MNGRYRFGLQLLLVIVLVTHLPMTAAGADTRKQIQNWVQKHAVYLKHSPRAELVATVSDDPEAMREMKVLREGLLGKVTGGRLGQITGVEFTLEQAQVKKIWAHQTVAGKTRFRLGFSNIAFGAKGSYATVESWTEAPDIAGQGNIFWQLSAGQKVGPLNTNWFARQNRQSGNHVMANGKEGYQKGPSIQSMPPAPQSYLRNKVLSWTMVH